MVQKKSTKKTISKSVKKTPSQCALKKKTPKKPSVKSPTKAALEKMKKNDDGFVLASQDAVKFLQSRRQAIFNIARHFHLDPEEIFQEGYEILLTCLRDYTPVYKKKNGETVAVRFTTFFGTRVEGRAMEMRNRDPEYQARQAYTNDLSVEDKAQFRENPPLLVQHLDQQTNMQESLHSEVSFAREEDATGTALKIARDSFFEKKLNELVAKEPDDKKRAALMHVKVGGIYNFQEMAYHFGVTDSRASQILNDLMDAFYIQRLIDGNLESVAYDLKKLKFNEKRAIRLLKEALTHASERRCTDILQTFKEDYSGLSKPEKTKPDEKPKESAVHTAAIDLDPFKDVFTDDENTLYPLKMVEVRRLETLSFLSFDFREPSALEEPPHIVEIIEGDTSAYPIIVNEDGLVIDGVRRVKAALKRGQSTYLCMTRHIIKERDARILRVILNARSYKMNKAKMYYAIAALADEGLSQQKIATALGTSRTNIIVYAKVKDKASPKLRALFEDGFIQITNASSCVDFSDNIQDKMANFIRKYGVDWSKGAQFNELHAAAVKNKIEKLEEKVEPQYGEEISSKEPAIGIEKSKSMPQSVSPSLVSSLQKRLETYEQALKDADIWTAQRESVIARQTQELTDAKVEIDAVRKELEAAELIRYGNPTVIEKALKELKVFYAFNERLVGASDALKKAARQVRGMELSRKHMREVEDMLEKIEKHTNNLRVELINKHRIGKTHTKT